MRLPHVVEQNGSTDLAEWVPLTEALDLPLLTAARHAIGLVPDGPAAAG